MSRLLTYLVIISFLVVITGCLQASPAISEKRKDHEPENSGLPKEENKDNKFTYLEDLTPEKIKKYRLFVKDGELKHLTNFKPEEMVLIYLNLVMKHKVELIKLLTYDNGKLPQLEEFNQQYEEYLAEFLEEVYLIYRYYDSIKETKQNRNINERVVHININYGSQSKGVAFGLKKEDNVWKMDLYHLILSKKTKKAK
ncbi:hypothetical protein KUV80_03945 [Fictibacillus nanhaiensis]|uniref:hypothetical protein n=1 Tax=Fictibacillus nanhaiensis TaxID=742169 RepID=UPI001C950AB9|nr:hypothetical protein [Fictibacillus nanhaiensis]MBY6035786.1 hypothetical protein [Fictibacillus nanhaiensis]